MKINPKPPKIIQQSKQSLNYTTINPDYTTIETKPNLKQPTLSTFMTKITKPYDKNMGMPTPKFKLNQNQNYQRTPTSAKPEY